MPVGLVTFTSVRRAADHVDADEVEAVALEPRLEPLDDAPVVVVERGLLRPATDVEVRTRLALGGHAHHGAERLTVEQQDALVAATHLGQIALRHREARAEARRLLEHREQVPVVAPHVEDALAAAPTEGLHDHLAAHALEEVEEAHRLARDQRVGHEVGEVHA